MPQGRDRTSVGCENNGDGPVAKGAARDQQRMEMPMLPLVLSSDSHVFEPPDLWQTRIDRTFRDRAPRIERIDGADRIVVEADQILSGIGLISNAGIRFEAPETASAYRSVRCRAGSKGNRLHPVCC
jgi:hypothetical protein